MEVATVLAVCVSINIYNNKEKQKKSERKVMLVTSSGTAC